MVALGVSGTTRELEDGVPRMIFAPLELTTEVKKLDIILHNLDIYYDIISLYLSLQRFSN
ncbi:hypothetical protein CYANOKiyG1_29800 [Okeania sp. KiyG1]|nr:hypothetical protein CYANOKiyG1_29800 [Okeania sp. KiyG1]